MAAVPTRVRIRDGKQLEIFLPVGSLFLQRRIAEAGLDPARLALGRNACPMHVVQIFVASDRTCPERPVRDRSKQSWFAPRFDPRFHQITHRPKYISESTLPNPADVVFDEAVQAWQLFRGLDRTQRATFIACFLGWALDAFDFFLLTFVILPIGQEFGRSVTDVGWAIALTLMMRPVGAFLFGLLGDRFGRRLPLMIDIIFYSVMELLTAFAPNFTVLLILRALYGIGMGGEWGLGASLAMEALPAKARGLFSGILQQGYAFGYLLAAIVYWIVFPYFGWRGLFVAGAMPALLVIYIRARVPESPAWKKPEKDFATVTISTFRRALPLFIYVVLLMTAFNYMSHGTQDLYQTFLETQRGLGVNQKAIVGIIYAVGAICGGTIFGHLSQSWGRRRAIIIAAVGGLVLIPIWVFSPGLSLLITGGFLMQFMVQGAWGIVPVHLNELSPPALRGTFPGLAYQLGNFLAANAAVVEAKLAQTFRGADNQPDYAKALAVFSAAIFIALIVLAAIGREERGKEF
jgi:MFS transporter, SHS family, lactate transporter